MALQHRLSDVVTMRLDSDSTGLPVVEIEFKFIRYRLLIDNNDVADRLITLLKSANNKKDKKYEEVKFPSFYKK